MDMSKSTVLLLVLAFLTASCLIAFTPVSAASPNSWASKAPMPQGKSNFELAMVNGKIYAIGGTIRNYVDSWTRGFSGTSETVNTNYEYDPEADRWTIKPPMPAPRYSFATAVYEDSIYCIGGVLNLVSYTGGVEVITAAVEAFTLSTSKWENKPPTPARRAYFATMVYEDN